ncbi:hypothetical protein SAMN05444000_104154 [Shimia gijangensis]|uniref:Uncharacterized protein n=1 Tax=Shimia gijangensis TaxID=1470563 RepID=A0A1M6FSL5_9RHOB|nr:hypothetical protein [Shimia gijangensis]SHJ00728.1 hypothetical protein SAMN05444000_104154 [Shimia gijangensis]
MPENFPIRPQARLHRCCIGAEAQNPMVPSESPVNPIARLTDLAAVSKLAHDAGGGVIRLSIELEDPEDLTADLAGVL